MAQRNEPVVELPPLKEVLEQTTAEINKRQSNGQSSPTPDAYGKTGDSVKENLVEYANVTAEAMENLGRQALHEAKEFEKFCYDKAAQVRSLGEERAKAAANYVRMMTTLTQALKEPQE